jgi:hypothetical protein
MILLTRQQANRIRGRTALGHALAPMQLVNGRFVLPESVLDDPAHARFHAFLRTLPTVPDDSLRVGRPQDPNDINSPIVDSDFVTDPDVKRENSYSPDWPVGELIVRD